MLGLNQRTDTVTTQTYETQLRRYLEKERGLRKERVTSRMLEGGGGTDVRWQGARKEVE